MSKQCLDISQMQHLKELGIDTSKASMVLIYTDCNCDVIEWDDVQYELSHPEPMEMFKELYDAETGNYDHSYRKDCGVFTLQDILDLLPKEMVDKDDDRFVLKVEYGITRKVWYIGYYYYDATFYDLLFSGENLIDAAYGMLCWCIENGYVETNKED